MISPSFAPLRLCVKTMLPDIENNDESTFSAVKEFLQRASKISESHKEKAD